MFRRSGDQLGFWFLGSIIIVHPQSFLLQSTFGYSSPPTASKWPKREAFDLQQSRQTEASTFLQGICWPPPARRYLSRQGPVCEGCKKRAEGPRVQSAPVARYVALVEPCFRSAYHVCNNNGLQDMASLAQSTFTVRLNWRP